MHRQLLWSGASPEAQLPRMLSARIDSTMAHKYHILSCLLISLNDGQLPQHLAKAGERRGAPPGASGGGS
uniref:Uncharacterized protein n=1 Tax=Arundo donax TaxID=35708 RepID=A0A0A9GE49_ARUDO